MGTDIRRCGKCHHFQHHKITVNENPVNRTLECMVCDEKLTEPIEEGFGNPFKDLGETITDEK